MSPERRLTRVVSWCRCLVLCLAFAAGSDPPDSKVAFLGYVVTDGGEKNVSAVLRVSAVSPVSSVRPGRWRASRSPDDCGGEHNVDYFDAAEVAEGAAAEETTVQVLLPEKRDPWTPDVPLFLCLATEDDALVRWLPLGRSTYFVAAPFDILDAEDDPDTEQRVNRPQRNVRSDLDGVNASSPSDHVPVSQPKIVSIHLADIGKYVSYGDNGVINVRQGIEVQLHVYGMGLTNDSEVKLTSSVGGVGQPCKSQELHVQTTSFPLEVSEDGTFGNLIIPAGTLPTMKGNELLYLCLRASKSTPFLHQGTFKSLQIEVYDLLLPVWVMAIFIVILLSLSGLFSGLNLGLMALDRTELKIVQNTGSEKEKNYANKIAPIRSHGNFLLCALLLGNVLVNNTMTILLDSLTSGIVAVIGSTMAIVVFGEIIPQAICSRHGLAVGANTIWLTKFFMLVTFPLAFPISKILDRILGAEIGTVYNKKRLIELLRVTRDKNDLEKEEVDIVTGALAYKEKTVRSCMTALSDVYMLNIKTILDFQTIAEIREQGYSRIPIYDTDRANIVYVLFVKDLMFIDPDDNTPLAMVCEYYKNDVNFVFHDTPLNVMFNEFKSGEKGHMAFVQNVNDSGDGDPFYETIGIITIEDIIEEIIQQEIIDETDVVVDNRTKKRRVKNGKLFSDFPVFHEHARKVNVSPQLAMAVFQYMITSIEPFKPTHMSEIVLKKLLTMDIFRDVKLKKNQVNEDELVIIEKGKPIDFFIMIVEGKVQANIGKEELLFESGPFSYYGLQVLTQVLDNPPSPVTGPRAITPNSMLGPSGESANPANRVSSLKKTSTQLSFEAPHVLNRRASSLTGPAAQEVGGLSGHNSAILATNFPPFIPDYTVKATSDVMYLVIKRTTYLRALKATSMSKKPSPSDMEFDKYLERVNEDDNILMPTPKMSPEKPTSLLERASSFASGRTTPTSSSKNISDHASSHNRHGGLNNSFHTFSLEKNKTEGRTVAEEDENQAEDEGEFWSDSQRSIDDKSPPRQRSFPVPQLNDRPRKQATDDKGSRSEVSSIVSAGALVVTVQSKANDNDTTQTVSPNGSTSPRSRGSHTNDSIQHVAL